MKNNFYIHQPTILSQTSIVTLKSAITLLQNYIELLGFKAQIHFELEGCYRVKASKSSSSKINYDLINQYLRSVNIEGVLVSEYWRNQWEYVSLFNGQSPLKEAQNLQQVITQLPFLFEKFYGELGVIETLIQPVVWSGDNGKLATGSNQIFTHDTRSVHIPNAIQLNVSVLNKDKKNIIAEAKFGEYLQQCFLQTSFECCLLFLPEEAAFERLKLKSQYGLSQELCSPADISGGHQGSIALYRMLGKHNQKMGEEPLLYDVNNKVLTVQTDWKKTARIEHRLGASSVAYNAYANVIYALLNIIDAIDIYEKKPNIEVVKFTPIALPESLFTNSDNLSSCGAIDIFKNSSWFSERLNTAQCNYNKMMSDTALSCQVPLGDNLKQMILNQYQVKFSK